MQAKIVTGRDAGGVLGGNETGPRVMSARPRVAVTLSVDYFTKHNPCFHVAFDFHGFTSFGTKYAASRCDTRPGVVKQRLGV
jgi:hypothetical protein